MIGNAEIAFLNVLCVLQMAYTVKLPPHIKQTLKFYYCTINLLGSFS